MKKILLSLAIFGLLVGFAPAVKADITPQMIQSAQQSPELKTQLIQLITQMIAVLREQLKVVVAQEASQQLTINTQTVLNQAPLGTPIPSCTINASVNVTSAGGIYPMEGDVSLNWTSQNPQNPLYLFTNYGVKGNGPFSAQSVSCELGACILIQSDLSANGKESFPFEYSTTARATEYKILMGNGTSCYTQINY